MWHRFWARYHMLWVRWHASAGENIREESTLFLEVEDWPEAERLSVIADQEHNRVYPHQSKARRHLTELLK